MTDHETFLLLAAKQIGERLSEEEEAALTEHLAGCPSCRAAVNAMRRDDILLRGELGATPVSPRVRRRVLEEAAGGRRFDWRVPLAVAATLLVAAVGVPLLVGGRPPDVSPSPTPESSVGQTSLSASDPASPIATESPSTSPAALPSSTPGSVSGRYVYGETPPRRDTVAAHFDPQGKPAGEWSRRTPAVGDGDFYGGPITCLVIDGRDAWMAGPATTATDGRTEAAMVYVHDGGPQGTGDLVVMWLGTEGQTITTMQQWCEEQFIPAGPYPITEGDVVVDDGV